MAGETPTFGGTPKCEGFGKFSHFQGAKKMLGSGKVWENISPNGKVIIVAFSAWRHRKVFFFCWGVQRFALHWSESQDKYWQRGNEKLETASFKVSPEGTVIAAHCEHQGHCHQQL